MFLSMNSILAASGFDRVEPRATGRPGSHPSVLLKLYIYGYLNRVRSSRRLERQAGRNVEVMWLTGRLVPDHMTIADFRKDNGPAIRKICSRFVALCRQLEPSSMTSSNRSSPLRPTPATIPNSARWARRALISMVR